MPPLAPGGKAACARCGRLLAKHPAGSSDLPLALTLAAAITLVIANTFPLMELHVAGRFASTTIAGGAYEMWLQGERLTSVLVGFCALIAPAGYISLLIMVLLAARRSPIPRWTGEMLRWVGQLQVWSMLEVVMLGILVALTKIAQLAAVDPGIGMYAFGATVLLFPAIMLSFDRREIWRRVEWMEPEILPAVPESRPAGRRGATGPVVTARRAGLVSCEFCHLVSRAAGTGEPSYCRRCGEKLAVRRHSSIETTWALLISAAICYIPANLLPVLSTTTPSGSEGDTILGGVAFLYTSGSWPLALVVLIASVMIPLGKLASLAYLLITVQLGSVKSNRERARLYRMVVFIGRWSMLDVFVDTFTVALVQLQPLMSVAPSMGVLFFAAVVVLTMLAAESFDPRLLWDSSDCPEPLHG
jgi:paraquat-inducible protein A